MLLLALSVLIDIGMNECIKPLSANTTKVFESVWPFGGVGLT